MEKFNLSSPKDMKEFILIDSRIDDVIILEYFTEPAMVVLVEPTRKEKMLILAFPSRGKKLLNSYKELVNINVPNEIKVTLKLVL